MGKRGIKPTTVLDKRLEAELLKLTQCQKCSQVHAKPLRSTGEIRATCKAHRRDGDPCRTWPIGGLAVCKMHGGKGKHVEAKAARSKALSIAARGLQVYGQPITINPVDALVQLIYASAGHVAWLRLKVDEVANAHDERLVWGTTELKDKTGGEDWGTTTTEKAAVNVWLTLYNQERDRLADYCAKAIKAGIDERRVRIAEQQGVLIANAINLILGDLRLTAAQQRLVPTVVPARLRELSEGTE